MKLLRGPLAVIRRKSKLTSSEAAEALGCSRTWLGRIERGESNPSMELAQKMARLYDTSEDEIVRLSRISQVKLVKQLMEAK